MSLGNKIKEERSPGKLTVSSPFFHYSQTTKNPLVNTHLCDHFSLMLGL